MQPDTTRKSPTKILTDIVAAQRSADTCIGAPDPDGYMMARRMTAFAQMTGGKGFREYPKEPAKRADGTTRGDRKRKRRAQANGAVSEARPAEYMHSAARRRLAAA